MATDLVPLRSTDVVKVAEDVEQEVLALDDLTTDRVLPSGEIVPAGTAFVYPNGDDQSGAWPSTAMKYGGAILRLLVAKPGAFIDDFGDAGSFVLGEMALALKDASLEGLVLIYRDPDHDFKYRYYLTPYGLERLGVGRDKWRDVLLPLVAALEAREQRELEVAGG